MALGHGFRHGFLGKEKRHVRGEMWLLLAADQCDARARARSRARKLLGIVGGVLE